MRFIVFLSGLLIMALEISVGRLITPFYGDGVTVWGAIIGVLLCALALGYYIGGYLADVPKIKKYVHEVFAGVFIVSGLTILLTPFFIELLSSTHILILSFSILIVPITLLGMVSPLVLKFSTPSLSHLGINSGSVYALGTLGSIVGTFGTVFGLFQFVSMSTIFLLLPALCALCALFVSSKIRFFGFLRMQYVAGVLLLLCAVLFIAALQTTQIDGKITFPSLYGEITIKELAGTRHLSVDGGAMSEMNLSNPLQRLDGWEYLTCMEAPFFARTIATPSVFAIGLGAGTFPTRIHALYGAHITVAEINPVMVRVAQKYFAFDEPVRIGDGRILLAQEERVFDVVSLDVMHYTNYSYRVPLQFSTEEFFTLAQAKLTPDGYFVMHVPTGPEEKFFNDVHTTLTAVFPMVTHYECGSSQVLVASKQSDLVPELSEYERASVPSGRVLRDEFIPTK